MVAKSTGDAKLHRVYVPTSGPTDWRSFLADPDKQWSRRASALELAVSWEGAQQAQRGMPPQVAFALDRIPALAGSRLLLGLPEHRVSLKGRGKASQTDLWALLRSGDHYFSMAIEGKAGEAFGPTLGEWLSQPSDGKRDRLEQLCQILQIANPPALELRYQLFHRTASAILEAQRFGAALAAMLVQCFPRDDGDDAQSWRDFSAFCQLLGAPAVRGEVVQARRTGSERLFLGWVDCPTATDSEIAALV